LLGVSFIKSLKSNLCTSLTTHNTTENNCIISHAQDTTAFQPNVFFNCNTSVTGDKTGDGRDFRLPPLVDEICDLLAYYAASCDNCLPTFRDNVSVPSSRVKSPRREERRHRDVDSTREGARGVVIIKRGDSQLSSDS
jgi:hypothetical protein